MKRRSLLKMGLAGAAVLTVAGGGLALMRPGLRGGRLTPEGRTIFAAVAGAVLDGVLPVEPLRRQAAIEAHVLRLGDVIGALPAHARSELSRLLAVLHSTPGRLALSGMAPSWAEADAAELRRGLQTMRLSRLEVRQQAYHALRNLTNAAYFSDPSTWVVLGYPGPGELG
jgi:hypothetical protein